MRAWTAVGKDSLVGQLDGGQRDNAQWPALASWWALHRLLRVWAPREGFYSLANAWPWGLLLLLRFRDGAFVGEVLRGGSSMRESRVEVLRIEFGSNGEPSKVTVCGRAGRVDPLVPTSAEGGLSLVSQRSMPLRGRASRSLAHAQLTAPGLTLKLKPPKKRKAKKVAAASGASEQEASSGGGRPSPVQRLRQRVAQLMGVGESYGAATEALAAAEEMEGATEEAAEDASGEEDVDETDESEAEETEEAPAGVFGGGNDIAALGRVARAWDPSATLNPAMDPKEGAKALNVELVASLLHLSGGWLRLRSVEGPCVAAKGVALQAAAALAAAVAVTDSDAAAVSDTARRDAASSHASSDSVAAPLVSEQAAVPYVRPGLYAGAYGDMYGQHKHEVLLVEYRSFIVTAADISSAGWQHGNSSAGKLTSVWGRIWREVFDGRPDPEQPGFDLFNTPSSCAMLVRVRDAIATLLALLGATRDTVENSSSSKEVGHSLDPRAAPSSSSSSSLQLGMATAEGLTNDTTGGRSGTEVVDEAFGHDEGIIGVSKEEPVSDAAKDAVSVEAVFCIGRKVTGDAHVPAGAASWGALCYPPVVTTGPAEESSNSKSRSSGEANSSLPDDENASDGVGFPHFQAATSVVGRHNNARIPVNRAWPGWGTLAFPGFERPSWSDGQLCQLRSGGGGGGGSASEGDDENDDGRFAFMWDRMESQPATVLKWLSVQQEYPFVNSA